MTIVERKKAARKVLRMLSAKLDTAGTPRSLTSMSKLGSIFRSGDTIRTLTELMSVERTKRRPLLGLPLLISISSILASDLFIQLSSRPDSEKNLLFGVPRQKNASVVISRKDRLAIGYSTTGKLIFSIIYGRVMEAAD